MLYLTLRQLEYVVTVARAGSLTAAANILNVSQPSLSVALTHVERQLRQRLFIRRKGVPMTTTSFGERYVAEAEALLSLAKRLEDPEATRRQLNGLLTLGCSEDLAPRYLAPMLKHLRALIPNVELRWKELDFGTLARDMIEGRVDIALTYDLGLDATFERTVLRSIAPHALVAETDDLRSSRKCLAARTRRKVADSFRGGPIEPSRIGIVPPDRRDSERHAPRQIAGTHAKSGG